MNEMIRKIDCNLLKKGQFFINRLFSQRILCENKYMQAF